jgi:AcrR family transcriptional regulator
MAADSPGAPGVRRRSAEVTRDKLLVATVELFAERGYDRIRVRDIAERAGVTTGAIYAHYADVAALLADAAGRALDSSVTAVVASGSPDLGPLLRTFITHPAEEALSREQELLLEAFVAARRSPRLREVLGEALAARLRSLEKALCDAQLAGTLRRDLPVKTLAWYFYLLPVGLLAGRGADLPTPDRRDTSLVLEALLSGLKPVVPVSS